MAINLQRQRKCYRLKQLLKQDIFRMVSIWYGKRIIDDNLNDIDDDDDDDGIEEKQISHLRMVERKSEAQKA